MPVSIYDVARVAGVSPSTVSRALEDHPRIGVETRKRIQELAREMDYVPSTVARSLTAKKTWTIGVVLPTISDPFMGRVVEGVEQVAIEAGFNVFISTSQNDRQREIAAVEMLQKRRVDGIIVMASHLFADSPRSVSCGKVPVVMIDEQNPGENTHFVAVDHQSGARIAVEYLLALGHHRIGYVSVPNRLQSNQCRLKGYQDALQAANEMIDPTLVISVEGVMDHIHIGEASLEPLLAAGATAVFCYNDATAVGLLTACSRRGFAIPEQLSIIGFDDIDMAAYTFPPLTTVRQPRFELGQRAMQMVLALLDGQEPANQIVPAELIVRQTTARFRRSRDLEEAD